MAGEWWQAKILRGFFWTFGASNAHSGNDLALSCGSAVSSPIEGDVIQSADKPWGGQVDILTHTLPGYPDPTVVSFLHLSRRDVAANTHVVAGQQLGASGQPPPGGRFGSGCHLHLETSAGSQAPYTATYNPWHPTKTSYPLDSKALLTWLGTGQAANTLGFSWGDFAQGILGGATATTAASAGGKLGSQFAVSWSWLTNPVRILKMVVGVTLMTAGIVLAFLPEVAETTAAAAGAPELAGAIGNATRKLQGPRLGFGPSAVRVQQDLQSKADAQARTDRAKRVASLAKRAGVAPHDSAPARANASRQNASRPAPRPTASATPPAPKPSAAAVQTGTRQQLGIARVISNLKRPRREDASIAHARKAVKGRKAAPGEDDKMAAALKSLRAQRDATKSIMREQRGERDK